MRNEMVTAWRRAGTAEILWTTPRGARGIPVVPLVWPQDGTPCAAVALSHLDDAESVADDAAFTVHTGEETPRTLVATGHVDVRLDLTGEEFVEHLLPQESAKHPPTRLRAESPMARRENWWWLPRVLITLTTNTRVQDLPARTHTEDALLVRGPADDTLHTTRPRLSVVTATRWPQPGEASEVELRARCGGWLDGNGEAAFVFGHRHSPDLERWESWYRYGTLRDDLLHVRSGESAPQPGDERAGAAEPFTLSQRWLNHRRTAKACKAGIARAEKRRN